MNEAERGADQHQRRRRQQRLGRTVGFRDQAPDPAAQRHAAEGRHLVERHCAPDHPARRRQLDRDVEQRQRQHPARAADQQADAVSQAVVESAWMVAETAKAMKPMRAIHSLAIMPRSRPPRNAPPMAPMP